MTRRENEVCPVCANRCGHLGVDDGVYQCDFCMAYHDTVGRATP